MTPIEYEFALTQTATTSCSSLSDTGPSDNGYELAFPAGGDRPGGREAGIALDRGCRRRRVVRPTDAEGLREHS